MEPLKLTPNQRINVIGTSGCGKSTFSKKLAEKLQVPYLEIDRIFWGPGWTMPTDDVFFKKLDDALNLPLARASARDNKLLQRALPENKLQRTLHQSPDTSGRSRQYEAGWVLDGNYTRTTPVKWKNVQTVIWLDYSPWIVFTRAFKRAISRVIKQTELWEGTGNRESFKMLFSKDSIVLWTLKTYYPNKEKYNKCMQDKNYAHIRFIRLSSPGEAERFLAGL